MIDHYVVCNMETIHSFLLSYKSGRMINMKLTNIILDDKLIRDCMQATGLNSHEMLFDYALKELLRRESQKKILELKGKICWEGDLDAWRKGRAL